MNLTGLTAGPSQVWGAVRLVPLLRPEPITDLRLHPRLYGTNELSVVALPDRANYVAFVPHAFVATWTTDGTAAAAYGTQLRAPDGSPERVTLKFRRRMARRDGRQRLRFLPLHLAFEGYLALQFKGPPIVWQEWTARAVRSGLSPRAEASYTGADITGLEDALRIFEIHPGQCGVAVYLADALAGVFVVPHPDDYRLLHPTLIEDFYGELIHQYANFYSSVPEFRPTLSDVDSVDGLRAQLTRVRADWHAFHATAMVAGIQPGETQTVYRMGRFTLSRFQPQYTLDGENHLGDLITADTGEVAYCATFRLSAAQVRRGHLLATLGRYDWHVESAAKALGTTPDGLVGRLDRAGFGDLLRTDIIDAYRARNRRP